MKLQKNKMTFLHGQCMPGHHALLFAITNGHETICCGLWAHSKKTLEHGTKVIITVTAYAIAKHIPLNSKQTSHQYA